MDFITYLFTAEGMTGVGHALILVYVGLLYRRVSKLEKQLIAIAKSAGAIAALFDYDDHERWKPNELDGRP